MSLFASLSRHFNKMKKKYQPRCCSDIRCYELRKSHKSSFQTGYNGRDFYQIPSDALLQEKIVSVLQLGMKGE
jgi:hypothetical protein